jgi:carbon-monoxide dehydrogenase medium subunit
MKPFTYLEPKAVDEAVKMLGEHGAAARVLSGGQSLLLALKDRSDRPAYLVSLAHVPGLKGWSYAGNGELEIGAAATYVTLLGAAFEGWHREIAAVAGNLADRSVRNMGTIGGSLAQADPRYDMGTLMAGIDARLTIASVSGERVVPAAEFFAKEGGTVLTRADLLTRITVPALSAWTSVAFEKFRIRVFDAAIVSAVAALKLEDGKITAARITVGAVEKAPTLAHQGAASLIGKSEIDAAALGDAVAEEALPLATATNRHRQYQRELVRTLVANAASRALADAKSGS